MRLSGWWWSALLVGVFALAAAGCDGGGAGTGDGVPGEDTTLVGEDTVVCVPACEGVSCGPDGCDGECGVCSEGTGCVDGQCVDNDPCATPCAATECGWIDVCNCGVCDAGLVCLDGVCDAPMACDLRDFEPVRTDVRMTPTSAGGFTLYVQALAGSAAPFDLLVMELDTAKGGITAPGDVDAAFTSFQAHGAWLYALQGWQGGSVRGWPGGGYGKLMVPARGRIEISALSADEGGRFTATLHAIQLVEATVDSETGAVTPVPQGQTWCLDDMVLDGEITHPNPACGFAGNGTHLGDIIEDFSLVNCYGQWINLHDRCQATEALWLVATAGW